MNQKFNKKIQASIVICLLTMMMFFPMMTLEKAASLPEKTQNNPGWWNPDWPYRKLVTINHTKVSADAMYFPMLLSLSSDAELAAAAQPNGQDLVFVLYADNTTVLAHELEFFNHTTGQLVAWVNVTLLSATNDTRIWMYYGNPFCDDQQNVQGTWQASYVLVQHLEEPNGTVYDSTTYLNNGTCYGGVNQTAQGFMDGGYAFDGVNDYVEIPNNTSLQLSDAITVEIWAKAASFNAYRAIATKDRVGDTEWWFGYGLNNQLLMLLNGGTYWYGTTITTDSNWHYLTGVYNGTHLALFYDGLPDNTPVANPPIGIDTGTVNLCITKFYGGFYFPGSLDEFRLSNVARPSSWIQTSYENQRNPDTFYSIGVQEPYLYNLTVFVEGQGSVIKDPDHPSYPYGTNVTLTATPEAGWSFDHWSGDLTGNQTPISLLIDGNKTVTAWFLYQNAPPVAENDSATVYQNSTNNSIDVLANDYDPEGENLSIIAVTQPMYGVASHDGMVAYYTPNASYTGSDTFTYTISDQHNNTASASVFLSILPLNNTPPYPPSTPVPPDGTTNVSITTDLWWIGGDPDPGDTVHYDVYFGTNQTPPLVSQNQSLTTYDPGNLTYETTYYWRIVAWDTHNASAEGALWMFTTRKKEGAVQVTITRPVENSFYIRNMRLFSMPRTTVLYGPIRITADVTSDTTVERVEFYVNGNLKNTDTSPPYTYRWAPIRCFEHVITVVAFDAEGNYGSDTIRVMKWRLHPAVFIIGWILLTTPP